MSIVTHSDTILDNFGKAETIRQGFQISYISDTRTEPILPTGRLLKAGREMVSFLTCGPTDPHSSKYAESGHQGLLKVRPNVGDPIEPAVGRGQPLRAVRLAAAARALFRRLGLLWNPMMKSN